MKFIDKFKMAIHNILNNKTSSLLTIIIVFIVSFLILSIMMFAINFSVNQSQAQKHYLNSTSSQIYIDKYYKEEEYFNSYPFTKEEMTNIINITKKYENICSSLTFTSGTQFIFVPETNYKLNYHDELVSNISHTGIQFSSFYFPLGVNNGVIDGRVWTEQDVNTNNVWVTDTFIQNALDKGLTLKIGDEIWLHSSFRDNRVKPEKFVFYSEKFVIQGVVAVNSLIEHNNQKSLYGIYNIPDIYIDLTYVYNIYDFLLFGSSSVTIEFIPPKTEYNFNEVYQLTNQLVQELSDSVQINSPLYQKIIYSSLIEALKLSRLISYMLIILATVFCIFILSLSIGSVANTIIISVDKSKKFYGLMKALGLKQREIESIVKVESLLIITFGVLLSTWLLFFTIPFFNDIITIVISNIYVYEILDVSFTTHTVIPFYLPIITNMVFLVMALLFSRSSLKNISNMDVISIISEVS